MPKILFPLLLALLIVAALVWRPGLEPPSSKITISDPQAHRHSFTNPYWPTIESPKLVTPQWIGEDGVEAAAVLSIDDMRGIEPYQSFLEPILQRLEEIDGRAPVSIFTNRIDPDEPQLQRWLDRGLSIEVHTIDHPCPLLHDGDFAKARETVHQCIDLLDGIPNMRPVAYRMPCCDSMNSVSPRFYDGIMGAVTPSGNFLSADSSVFQVFTAEDPELPGALFSEGQEKRFQRYLPLGKDFVNIIENYPYPYLIGKQHWQFPCTVPSDWAAQYLQGKNDPRTVEDLKAALDATVAKQGLFVLVFHPHGWIENTQVAQLVDHAQKVHGEKLKFLNMREVQERIDTYLLDNQPVRQAGGFLSGTQVLDVNGDGYMDVLHESDGMITARIWEPGPRRWQTHQDVDLEFVSTLVLDVDGDGQADEPDTEALRFWDLDDDGDIDAVYSDAERFAVYLREDDTWKKTNEGLHNETKNNAPPPFIRTDGSNNGVWMGRSTFIIQNEDTSEEPNVIRRVPFQDVLTQADETEEQGGLLSLKPLDPDEALQSMATKPGLEIQLAVHEPLVMDPIDIAWGPDGKLWVVEMTDYPLGIDDEGTVGGRVRFLEDTDQDGRYESSTLFLDGLPYPTGVMAWRRGALVLAAPDLLYAEDTDGDGKADHREVLYTGFGEGNQQHRVNGLRWGLDNWIYLANGDSGGEIRSLKTGETVSLGQHDLRIRPEEGLLELVSGKTQFGRNRNDAGDWFGCNNSNPLWHYVIDEQALRRNTGFSPPRPIVHLPEIPGNAPVFPASVTHERFNDFHTANAITSACGAMIYRAGLLGEAYRDNAFIAEPVHNLVHRQVLTEKGVTFASRRAPDEQASEFFTSTDPWSRPVSIHTAPDGALWVVDMYRHVIEHPEWIPHDWQSQLDLRAGHDRGRLYRIAPEGHQPEPAPDLTALDDVALIAMLGHDSGTLRDLAQQLLLRRAPAEAGQLLLESLTEKDWRHRLHALATLDGLGQATRSMVESALEDPHPAVRRLAIRLAGKLEGDWQFPQDETDAKVLLEKAVALGQLAGQGEALAELALHSDDPFIRAACVSSMLADAEGFLERLAQATFTEEHAQLLQWVMSSAGPRALAVQLSETNALEIWRLKLVQQALPELRDEVRPMLDAAREALDDRATATDLRSAALEFICAAEDIITQIDSLTSFCRPEEPLTLQMTAVRMIAEHFPETINAWLPAAWPSLEPALRQEISQWLSSRPQVAARVVEELGATPVPDLLRSLAQHPDGEVRQAAEALLGATPAPDHETLIDAVLSVSGRREQGKIHFSQLCAVCHVLENEGNAIGPDLTTLANPSPEFLLRAILNPNEAVEDKYLAYVAETNDGDTTIGLLEGESGGALRLRLANGESQEILRRDLRRILSTGRSLMPESLTAELTPQDIADLLAYIRSARPPRKEFAFNEPALVQPEDDGAIKLAATTASVHGPSLTFERRYLHLGTWKHVQDQAIWTFHCAQPGRYEISIDFSCADDSAGNTLALEIGDQRQSMKVPGTGNWNGFQEIKFGKFDLTPGEHELVARSEGPIRDLLIDLRTVILKPVNSAAK